MPSRKKSPNRRRLTRKDDAMLPEVPVRVAGPAPSKAPAPQPELQPDPREEEIRRMIEAAYT